MISFINQRLKNKIYMTNHLKVLVGAPISDNHAYCINQYLESIMNLSYPNYDILLVDNSTNDVFFNELKQAGFKDVIRRGYDKEFIRERMVVCRNILRDKVLNEDYDYFFNIDQDVIPPKDIIKRFLAHKKPIITGIYLNHTFEGGGRFFPTIWGYWMKEEIKKTKEKLEEIREKNPDFIKLLEKYNYDFSKLRMPITMEEIEKPRLMKIRNCGSGCLFIKKEVLEKIKFRYEKGEGFDDVWFCEDAINLGYEIYADTSIKCRHLIKDRPWTWKYVGDEMHMYKRKK